MPELANIRNIDEEERKRQMLGLRTPLEKTGFELGQKARGVITQPGIPPTAIGPEIARQLVTPKLPSDRRGLQQRTTEPTGGIPGISTSSIAIGPEIARQLVAPEIPKVPSQQIEISPRQTIPVENIEAFRFGQKARGAISEAIAQPGAAERFELGPVSELPFRVGRGIRQAATEALPAAASVADVGYLPARAVGYGIAELRRGLMGEPSRPFERAPITAAVGRMVAPTPLEREQRLGRPPIAPTTTTTAPAPPVVREPEIAPRGEIAAPAPAAPLAAPVAAEARGLRPEEASVTPAGPYGRLSLSTRRILTRDPATGEEFPMTFIQGGEGPPALREPFLNPERFGGDIQAMAAANAAIADYNRAAMEQYGERVKQYEAEVAGIPREQAQAELARVQAAEEPLEAESRRGLRAAQTALATRSAEAAKLLKTRVEVPTGDVDALGQPITTTKELVYNPDTGQFIDPTAARTQPRQVAPTDTLRSEYAALSESDRGVVEKYFADREDITPEEVLTFIRTLGK